MKDKIRLKREVRVFRTSQELAEDFALDFINHINEAQKKGVALTIALSGGNTPKLFFSVLAEKYSESVDWSLVHFFWGDERCVAPDNPESNFRMIREILLLKIAMPQENIHRIRGEEDPEKEALRYSDEIKAFTRSENHLPSFDIMILGMGDDGHTASIFPGNLDSFSSQKICDVSVHPVTGQKRITVTGKVINNSGKIIFIVTGDNKARIIEDIFKEKAEALHYPASYVHPISGNAIWMLDESAAGSIR